MENDRYYGEPTEYVDEVCDRATALMWIERVREVLRRAAEPSADDLGMEYAAWLVMKHELWLAQLRGEAPLSASSSAADELELDDGARGDGRPGDEGRPPQPPPPGPASRGARATSAPSSTS